ncbi:MAG: hypothetical protein Q4F12_03085 [Erysipelotrichaceae bacterium]|nr:hypothetical protein [Erysipelotrichaceae bacterium]
MEARDIALYGFVSAASKYVDRHMNDGTNLGDLKNIDIKKLKDDLSAQFKFLALSDKYKKDLEAIGEKAFDEYAKENLVPKHSVIDELGEIFDVSFDEFDKETVETKNDIDSLLDAYDLDEKVSVTSTVNKQTNDDLDEFGLSANDDVLLTIANAAAKSDEELAKRAYENDSNNTSIKKPANMDETYADVISNESNEPEKLSSVLSGIGKTEVVAKEEVKEEIKPQETSYTTLSSVLSGIGKQEVEAKEVIEKAPTQELKPADGLDILANPALDIVLEREKDDAQSYYNLTKEETIVTSNPGIESQDKTLSEVIAGLGNLQKKQEENSIQIPVDPNEAIYSDIMEAYPYLNKGFIRSAYEQKNEIKDEYEENKEYILLHRLIFSDLDELHEFVEIMMSHDYTVNVDETKMIVDAFNKFVNEDGSILASILSIANQAKILNGEYDGYRVIDIEGK